jgi:alpha-L-fucosidase
MTQPPGRPTRETISRREFARIGLSGLVAARLSVDALGDAASVQTRRPVPTPAQLEWQRDELALFLHFGVNTFTDREWGDGKEDPGIFAPSALDARQWARAARAAGFRMMILTAKHHDGFCLWPSAVTKHSVAASPFRGGNGDVVREFVDACRAEGLKAGLYCSPWDRNSPVYGDSPRYNDFFCDQLTELLTRYGRIDEVWFDGANGEGPNGRKQVYDWPRFWALVRRLQPNAVMFSDAGPDIRWIGNERGSAGETNWSTMDPNAVPYPGADGAGIIAALQNGDPNGTVWRPGETDVSIRPGWFYHPAEDAKVKTVDDLVDLYFTSVGRNSKLLLNVPPTRAGLLHDVDVARVTGMRQAVSAQFRENFAEGRAWTECTTTIGGTLACEIDLGRERTISIIDLREEITRGQSVSSYRVEAHGSSPNQRLVLAKGTTIGYRRLHSIAPVRAQSFALVIESLERPPRPVEMRVYNGLRPIGAGRER